MQRKFQELQFEESFQEFKGGGLEIRKWHSTLLEVQKLLTERETARERYVSVLDFIVISEKEGYQTRHKAILSCCFTTFFAVLFGCVPTHFLATVTDGVFLLAVLALVHAVLVYAAQAREGEKILKKIREQLKQSLNAATSSISAIKKLQSELGNVLLYKDKKNAPSKVEKSQVHGRGYQVKRNKMSVVKVDSQRQEEEPSVKAGLLSKERQGRIRKVKRFHKDFCNEQWEVKEELRQKLLSYDEVLGVIQARNKEWIKIGKYGGASINIQVSCSRQMFIEKHPEYQEEPYVIVPEVARRTFIEQVIKVSAGEKIRGYSSDDTYEEEDKFRLNNKSNPSGCVGFWLDTKKNETIFGITAFHVLDYNAELQGARDPVFLLHQENCRRGLSGQRYVLDNSKLLCTYFCGIFSELIDVGVVKCTVPEGVPTESLCEFLWPKQVDKEVTSDGKQLKTVLLNYEYSLESFSAKINVFHNGPSSRSKEYKGERKRGVLVFDFEPCILGMKRDGGIIELNQSSIVVEFPNKDHEEVEEVQLDDFELAFCELHEDDSSTESECEDDLYGVDTGASGMSRYSSGPLPDSVSEPAADVTTPHDLDTACSTSEVNDRHRSPSESDGAVLCLDMATRSFLEVNDGTHHYAEDENAVQAFTEEGDSGCTYYIKFRTQDNRIIRAPIGIHRGTHEGSRFSYASPFDVAFKEIGKKITGSDVRGEEREREALQWVSRQLRQKQQK